MNGQSLGVKKFNKKQTSDGRTYQEGANAKELYLEWKVAYQPGTLEAVARDEAGKEIARDKITTAGQPAGVRLITVSYTHLAAQVAAEAGAKRLLLNHISARFLSKDISQLKKDAATVFENVHVVKDLSLIHI